MPNALDMFRAQREAADALHARITEVTRLLEAARQQIDGLALSRDLKETLRDEQIWLERTERAVAQVRYWRESEQGRFGWSIVWRWTVAVALALGAVSFTSAAQTWMAARTENRELRERAEFGDVVSRRLQTMTPAERRQFDRLMQPPVPSTR
jgi:hypothetical protein